MESHRLDRDCVFAMPQRRCVPAHMTGAGHPALGDILNPEPDAYILASSSFAM